MGWLSRKLLAHRFDVARLERAIAEAERRTSGEIVVSMAPFFLGNVQRAAERAFARLGVSRTREQNGVLFFVVPSRRTFMVLGDAGIHGRVGQEFWEQVAGAVSRRFKAGDMTGGLVDGIEEVGRRLAEHFPFDAAADVDELSDAIDGHAEPRPGVAR